MSLDADGVYAQKGLHAFFIKKRDLGVFAAAGKQDPCQEKSADSAFCKL